MRSYVYRCGVCRARSGAGPLGRIEAVRDNHRRIAHHGLEPEGESIERVSTGRLRISCAELVALSLFALLLIIGACERLLS